MSLWKTPDEARFTPQGTRVPDRPPPEVVIPEVPIPPSWMTSHREVRGEDRAEHLCDGTERGDRAEHLREKVARDSRAEHGGSYHGGREWHHQHQGREHGDARGGNTNPTLEWSWIPA